MSVTAVLHGGPSRRLGAICQRIQDAGHGAEEPLSVYLGRGVVRRSDTTDNHNVLGTDLDRYQLVEPGDLVFNRLRTWQGGFGASPYRGIVSPAYIVLRPTDADSRFLQYVLWSKPYLAELTRLSKWMPPSQFDILWTDLRTVEVPFPSLEEQRRIADFLDDRVARIDQIIAGRQQQVAGLDEQFATERRLAIRGLAQPSADAPAPSWIGHVGQGWMTRRIGQLAAFYAGVGFPPDEQGATTGDLPLLKVSDLANSDSLRQIGTAANWITLEQASTLGARPAPAGTILLPKVGAALLTNNRAIATRSVTFDNNVMGIRFRHGDDRFWLHVLHCIDMGAVTNPGPVPSINRENVASLPVPFPAPPVQAGIAAELDAALVDSRARRTQLEQQITLLNEYKQSLITAAVTGEFDVTTAAPIPE